MLLCLSFACALRVAHALPRLVVFVFVKGPVSFGAELNILLVPRWGGGGICSLPWMTSVPGHFLPRSKGSAAELWRPWLFFQQHYWVFFWLLLLSIAFLLLARVLELQRLQSAASSKA